VERRNNAAAAQPDEGGVQQLIWQLGQHWELEWCLGKEKAGASKVF
jgi:hypothetical protein